MYNITIPQAWKDMLDKVQTKYPNAIIAGGCLRDLDYGKEVKDVDIFIPAKDFKSDLFADTVFELFGITVSSNEERYKNYEDGFELEKAEGRSIFGLFQIERDGYNFELIFGSNQTACIEDFDYSICQIGYNGKEIFSTYAYDRTKKTLLVTLENPRPAHRTNQRHVRLAVKFPDMTVESYQEAEGF